MTEPRLLLLDSASLYFRAFFGVPDDRADPSAPPTNAVRGFLDFIATLGPAVAAFAVVLETALSGSEQG